MPTVSKIYLIPEKEFRQLVAESYSYNEILKKIGMGHGRSSNDIIKRRCKELNISCDHFRLMGNRTSTSYSLEEILIKDSPYTNTSHLRERLIKEKILEYRCAICGNNGVWLENPLSLQLDHINGDHRDNRLENLRLLCPNCHSQTETYGFKKRKEESKCS